MNGWISLHRKVFDNPIIRPKKPYSKFEAWCWLIIRANHTDSKFVLGTEIIKASKGEVITSQKKLSLQFGWGNTKLSNFLKLLQNDNMINLKTTTKTTRITICNYLSYQDKEDKVKVKPRRKQDKPKMKSSTMNKENKENNVNNVNNEELFRGQIFTPENEFVYGKQMLDEFWLFYSEPTQDNKMMKYQTFDTWSTGGRLSTWSKKDYNGYYKMHKDEIFRRNANKVEPIPDVDIATPDEVKEIVGETKFKLRSM